MSFLLDEALEGMKDENIRILELLHTYRFLTLPQILRIVPDVKEDTMRKALTLFSKQKTPIVSYLETSPIRSRGRVHRMYYMTEYGAKTLAELWNTEPKEIQYPKLLGKDHRIYNDYYHRVATVDFHIAVVQFCESQALALHFFHTYYHTEGANRGTKKSERLQKLTKTTFADGSFFIPDINFMITTPEKTNLYAVEIYNGKDTGRVLVQMEKHLLALSEGAVSKKYGFERGNRVLCIFETMGAMTAVMNRMKADPLFGEVRSYFFLSTLETIWQYGFGYAWKSYDGNAGNIF